MIIRQYNDQDISSLERLAKQVVDDGTVFPFEDEQGVLDYWLSPGARTFVVDWQNQVVGTFVIKPNLPDRCSHIANAGYMVDEARRGQGIGRTMSVRSLEIARELGFRAMQFNIVVATNLSAIRLWEELGFVRIGQIPKAFRHPSKGLVAVWIMHREL